MFINNSEWVAESSYCNSYCSCLFMRFNKIDSPLIIIPTLDLPNSPFDFELKIYSNREARVFSLNNEKINELVTSIDGSSTDSEYPSAKCLYTIVYGNQ